MTKFENISRYREAIDRGEAVVSIWTVEDVRTIDSSLTKDECVDVLDYVISNLDTNKGINWDVIENAIYVVKFRKSWKNRTRKRRVISGKQPRG